MRSQVVVSEEAVMSLGCAVLHYPSAPQNPEARSERRLVARDPLHTLFDVVIHCVCLVSLCLPAKEQESINLKLGC